MQAIFKYNDKLYQCMNLDKKLKKLKLTRDDIELIWEGELSQDELEKKFNSLNNFPKNDNVKEEDITLYKFTNGKHIIVSIYDNLNNLEEFINIKEYDRID